MFLRIFPLKAVTDAHLHSSSLVLKCERRSLWSHRNLPHIFITALFIAAKIMSFTRWIKKINCGMSCSALNRNELPIHGKIWRNLMCKLLCERSSVTRPHGQRFQPHSISENTKLGRQWSDQWFPRAGEKEGWTGRGRGLRQRHYTVILQWWTHVKHWSNCTDGLTPRVSANVSRDLGWKWLGKTASLTTANVLFCGGILIAETEGVWELCSFHSALLWI